MKGRRLAVSLISLFVLILNITSITTTSQAAPAVDPVNSTVVASPTLVPADGVSFTRITVNAVAVNGKPVNITSASLLANPATGLVYAVAFSSNPPPVPPGQAVFVILSTVPEQVTFTAVINGVTLQQTPVVTFGLTTGLVQ